MHHLQIAAARWSAAGFSSPPPSRRGNSMKAANANQMTPRIDWSPMRIVATSSDFLEGREPVTSAADEPHRDEREQIEGGRLEPGGRRLPFVDVVPEPRVDEDLAVVLRKLQGVRGGNQACDRRAAQHRRARKPGLPRVLAAIESVAQARQHDEQCARDGAPVDVGPENEDREDEQDSAGLSSSVGDEEPDKPDEEHEGEALSPRVPRSPDDQADRRNGEPGRSF